MVSWGLIYLVCSCQNMSTNSKSNLWDTSVDSYPVSREDTISDNYFGTVIKDPFRWLEDDRSVETEEWVKSQNQVTFNFLDSIPFRKTIRERLGELNHYEKCSAPVKKAGHYYFFKNSGSQNQDVLYGTDSLGKPPETIIDPNLFSKDGTTSLSGYSFSKDGKYMAFQISEGGSDWNSIMVMDLATKTYLPDTIRWVKFSNAVWRGNGFYYSRYPEPGSQSKLSGQNEFHAVYYHELGKLQQQDRLIYVDRLNPKRNASVDLTEDERYLILSTTESTSGNAFAIMDLKTPQPKFQWIVNGFENDFTVIGNEGDQLFVHTNAESPNWKLYKFSLAESDFKKWQTLIPESEDRLEQVKYVNGMFLAVHIHKAYHTLQMYDQKGKRLRSIDLPEPGTLGSLQGEPSDQEIFFSFTSFIRPNTIYRLDLSNDNLSTFFTPIIKNYSSEAYQTDQVYFKSKDGTEVPMFITYKKGIFEGKAKQQPKPTLLYGYGGFDIPVMPAFAVSRLLLLEHGGIYAVANIRGGGEFGKQWHKAGTLSQKQNVFDDFMAAADHLVEKQFTDRAHLAIEGRSNGGLLVGACMTQRPDLCQVAFPGVGVLDMLRYHKFTIGWAWATDYGTSDTKEGFDYLIKYSPVHNVKKVNYPATLITTADHDDRVVPAHSFKFAAALQQAQQGKNPVLIRIDVSAGHGAGKPTSKRLDEAADVLSFMFYNMQFDPTAK